MAYWTGFFLLFLSTIYTSSHAYNASLQKDYRKPTLITGAIRSYIGEIFLIQDYLAVTINHNVTTKLPNHLMTILEETSSINGNLSLINITVDNNDKKLVEEVLYTNGIAQDRIKEALTWFPNTKLSKRTERGLMNIVGIGLK